MFALIRCSSYAVQWNKLFSLNRKFGYREGRLLLHMHSYRCFYTCHIRAILCKFCWTKNCFRLNLRIGSSENFISAASDLISHEVSHKSTWHIDVCVKLFKDQKSIIEFFVVTRLWKLFLSYSCLHILTAALQGFFEIQRASSIEQLHGFLFLIVIYGFAYVIMSKQLDLDFQDFIRF